MVVHVHDCVLCRMRRWSCGMWCLARHCWLCPVTSELWRVCAGVAPVSSTLLRKTAPSKCGVPLMSVMHLHAHGNANHNHDCKVGTFLLIPLAHTCTDTHWFCQFFFCRLNLVNYLFLNFYEPVHPCKSEQNVYILYLNTTINSHLLHLTPCISG